jgi:hypothetical protein
VAAGRSLSLSFRGPGLDLEGIASIRPELCRPTEGACKSVVTMRFKRSEQRRLETGLDRAYRSEHSI